MCRALALFLLLPLGCSSYTGDLRVLQGTWTISYSFGEEERNQRWETLKIQLSVDDHLISKIEGEKLETLWRIALRDDVVPKQIDLEIIDGEEKGQIHRGIYELDRDGWHLCIQKDADKPRPHTLVPGEKGSGIYFLRLVRPI